MAKARRERFRSIGDRCRRVSYAGLSFGRLVERRATGFTIRPFMRFRAGMLLLAVGLPSSASAQALTRHDLHPRVKAVKAPAGNERLLVQPPPSPINLTLAPDHLALTPGDSKPVNVMLKSVSDFAGN